MGTVPEVWREAIVIPILKRGKNKSKAESYQPISLTRCVGKLMECLINTRLMWHLEDKKHITPEQAAFRKYRSTEDQITHIAQAIEDAFQDKKHTLAVWIDLEKAFDKVWKEGLKSKLHQCGVAGRMYKWIGQYMHNRKAKVQIKQHLSKKRTLRLGVPQGGVLSTTLFLIFIRDILHRMPKNIQGAIYADDLALWCSEEYITTANYRLQQALQVIESWTWSWLVNVNEKKTTFTIFSLSNQKHSVHLKLNRQTLHQEDTPTYLGVTLDWRPTWINEIQKNQARAKIRLALMKKLSCTEWGADQNVLKKLYESAQSLNMEWQQAPPLQNQTLVSYPECSTRPWEWWLVPCEAHPYLQWRRSQACSLWKTDMKLKYWHRLQSSKDSRTIRCMNAWISQQGRD